MMVFHYSCYYSIIQLSIRLNNNDSTAKLWVQKICLIRIIFFFFYKSVAYLLYSLLYIIILSLSKIIHCKQPYNRDWSFVVYIIVTVVPMHLIVQEFLVLYSHWTSTVNNNYSHKQYFINTTVIIIYLFIHNI